MVGLWRLPCDTSAVRAARDMQETLAAMNDDLERRWGVRLTNRTGVNTGEVVAGAGDLDAADQRVLAMGQQDDPVRIADQGRQLRRAGAIIEQQVGLMRPAGLGGVAAIGALDQGMQRGDVVGRRRAYGDRRHRLTPSSASR